MFKHILMKKKTICVLAGILLVLIVWIVWGNTALELSTYTISSRGLPDAFDSYRIAQVSDLHNAEFGDGNQRLLDMLREAEPDMIAIIGDLIDSRKTNIAVALTFENPSKPAKWTLRTSASRSSQWNCRVKQCVLTF